MEMKRSIFVVLLLCNFLVWTGMIHAGTYSAKSANYADVNSCYLDRSQCNGAGNPSGKMQDGDKLTIPAGTPTDWAGKSLTIDVSISVEGAGKNTVLTSAGGTDRNPLFILNASPNGVLKTISLGQMKLAGGGANTTTKIRFIGNNSAQTDPKQYVRVHHIWFTATAGSTIAMDNSCVFAVVDHCYFPALTIAGSETISNKLEALAPTPTPSGYAGSNNGDGSWATDGSFNTFRAVYYEDCIYGHALDGEAGCRYVVRNCTTDPGANLGLKNHGQMDSGGAMRGCVEMDCYNNLLNNGPQPGGNTKVDPSVITYRGGSGRVFNNYNTGTPNQFLNTYNYVVEGTPRARIGPADGACIFDINTVGTIANSPPDASPVHPHPVASPAANPGEGDAYVHVAYTGTTIDTLPSQGEFDVTLPITGHIANCFKFYTMSNRTQPHPPFGTSNSKSQTVNWVGYILSNTASTPTSTTFHIHQPGTNQGGAATSLLTGIRFHTGDMIDIRHVDQVVDGDGMGKGKLIDGVGTDAAPALPHYVGGTPQPGGLAQIRAVIYCWNNFVRPANATATGNVGYSAPKNWPFRSDGTPLQSTDSVAPATPPTLAQVREGREVVNGPPPASAEGGTFNWDSAGTSWIGADDWISTNFGATYPPRFQASGSGGTQYPHPMVQSGPTITNSSTTTFLALTAPNCASGSKVNCFQFSASGFSSGTIVWAPTSAGWPTGVTLNASTGVLQGNPPAPVSGTTQTFPVSVTATNSAVPTEVAQQSFSLKVDLPNQPPNAFALTSPTGGQTFTAPATITISCSPSDPNDVISKVEFYKATGAGSPVLLSTDSNSPFSFDDTAVAAGTYTYTAIAYDSFNSSTTSSGTTVTVNSSSSPTPTPATISIRP